MANPTSNFGWVMPTSTDLVTDLPADFEVFGQAVDTSLADLKGGTTGQILSKNSNTNMDFTWITNDVGDITAVTAGTGITGGGTSGDVTVSFDQANFGGGQGAAGKNAVINGGMDIWQRGTSISVTTNTSAYTADRWFANPAGLNLATTVSRQATGDTTNLPNIQYALRYQRNSGQTGTAPCYLGQSFESVNSIPYAGKVVTFSFYARCGANYSPTSSYIQTQLQAGTSTDSQFIGGVTNVVNTNTVLTTTWQRFTYTSTTIPTNTTQIGVLFTYNPTGTAGTNDYFEVTGLQVELNSTATPFKRNGATYQSELAACQRYYWRTTSAGGYVRLPMGSAQSTTQMNIPLINPVTMRTTPTTLDYSTLGGTGLVVTDFITNTTPTTFVLDSSFASSPVISYLSATVASGLTAFRPYTIGFNASTTGYIGISAEL